MSKKALTVVFVLTLGLTIFSLNRKFKQLADSQVKVIELETSDSFKNGDLIFQISLSGQGKAIQLATKSKFTHVGILFKMDDAWKVYEAVEPVQCIDLNTFIERGDSGHYVVLRMKNRDSVLKSGQLAILKSYLEQQLNKHYDLYFSWSDETMYCSELVWKAFQKAGVNIGELRLLSSFDLSSKEVKSILKERYGNKIPYNESVISPGDLFKSRLFETVLTK